MSNAFLRRFGAALSATPPRAVLCLSAHFATPKLTITTADAPPTLHDHDVAELLSVSYEARGDKLLARRVIEHLLSARLQATGDESRGLDHGAWMPLSLLFPAADIPVVQLSLLTSCDPELHFAIGRALEPLRDEGVLILGSGSLTYESRDAAGLSDASKRFQSWVTDLVTGPQPYSRGRGLTRFRDHPDVRHAHPTDEHFMPLLVVAGAASSDRSRDNVAELLHAGAQRGLSMAAFRFRR